MIVWVGFNLYQNYFVPHSNLPPSGGLYFLKEVALPVPLFTQGDEAWGDQLLGPTFDTLAQVGCAVSSAAMILKYYGYDTDPGQLNQFLNLNMGYTPEGWIYWEIAALVSKGHLRHAYEDLPSYYLIDKNLLKHNPVIVRIHVPGRLNTHFVVIMGKRGSDYLIRDPGPSGVVRGVYPLKDLVAPIEALRFYEPIAAK